MDSEKNENHILWSLQKGGKTTKKQMIHVEIYKDDDERLKLLGILKGGLSKSQLVRESITDYLLKNKELLDKAEKLLDKSEGEK